MKKIFLAMVLVLLSFLNLAYGQAPQAAATCIGCHGVKGVSANDLWPNLAGQKKGYIAKQLMAFKTGERKDPMMSPISSSLQDSDIQALAQYFSNLNF